MYKSVSSFYSGKEWNKLRKSLMLSRVNEEGILLCAKCGKPIVKSSDCIGHHVVPLTDANVSDATVSLNPDNIELVHMRCHNIIENRFTSYEKKVYIVYGAPISEREEYVAQVSNADDLVVNIDRIWECLTTTGIKRPRLSVNVFAVRDLLYDQVRVRSGDWVNAYVIITIPLRNERERLAKSMNAELIYIESERSDCPPDHPLYKFNEQWWEDYDPPTHECVKDV